jgi:hypothetical protein
MAQPGSSSGLSARRRSSTTATFDAEASRRRSYSRALDLATGLAAVEASNNICRFGERLTNPLVADGGREFNFGHQLAEPLQQLISTMAIDAECRGHRVPVQKIGSAAISANA